jgi:outer membrane protein OmpU
MKKVLLTSTALVMTAGVAAADMTMSASATLTYGNFGTGTDAGGANQTWSSEAELTVSGSGGGGLISYSAGLELDEGSEGVSAFTVSSSGFSFTYDADDIGGLVVAGDDGEDDNTGDYKVSYAAGGLSASYETDVTSEDTLINLGYTAGDLTLGLEVSENDNAIGGSASNTTSVAYVMGAYTMSIEADDADAWDASVAYTTGDTTVTVAADEADVMSVAVAYAAGDVGITARQEFGGTGPANEETELSVSYAAGDLTFGASFDSGQGVKYGDEAETVINMSYAVDGATLAAKANDQDEVEVSVSFDF